MIQTLPFYLDAGYWTKFWHALKDRFFEEVKIGDIGEGIKESITPHVVFEIKIFGLDLPVTDAVVSTWIAMAAIILIAFWLGKSFKDIPDKRQVLTEGYVGIFMSICKGQHMNEEQASKVAPFVGTMAALICVSNVFAVFKLSPPSKNPAFPISLALFTLGYVIVTGIRLVGLKGFWKSLSYPRAALVPFKILDYLIKPISLSLRLFGNIFGAFILMEFIYIIIPVFIPALLGLWFELADGILQGAVFSYLTIVYVGEIVEASQIESDEPGYGAKFRNAISIIATAQNQTAITDESEISTDSDRQPEIDTDK